MNVLATRSLGRQLGRSPGPSLYRSVGLALATLCALLFAPQNAGAQVVEIGSDIHSWDEFAPSWIGGAFEQQFSPTPTPPTGCLSSIGAVSQPLDGGWLSLVKSGGDCPILDGTSFDDVADAAIDPDETLTLTFDPPIRAFYSYFSSLAVDARVTLRLQDARGLLDHVVHSDLSRHQVEAIGFGFVSREPVSTITLTSSEAGRTLLGRFGGSLDHPHQALETVRAGACDPWQCDFAYAYDVDFEGSQIYELRNPSPGFARALAVDQDWLAVGIDSEPHGKVRLYGRSHGGFDNWGLVKTLAPPMNSGEFDNRFGIALALQGDTLIVGADRFGFDGGFGYGIVFVFGKDVGGTNNWGHVQTIARPGDFTSAFGASLAMQNDELVVGAPDTTTSGLGVQAGIAYLFRRPAGQVGGWEFSTSFTAPFPYPGARFGSALAMNGDGLVIGVPGEAKGGIEAGCAFDLTGQAQGSAYLFRKNPNDGNWTCAERLRSSCAVNSPCSFGSAVAIRGDMTVVGAPEDYLGGQPAGNFSAFRRTRFGDGAVTAYFGWTPQTGARLGQSVAMAADRLYVGASPTLSGFSRDGAVHVFGPTVDSYNLPAWSYSSTLQPLATDNSTNFGKSAAQSESVIAVGGSNVVLLIDQKLIFADGFESGGTERW